MSAIFDELEKIDAKEGIAAPPWPAGEESGQTGILPCSLPEEILSDFYDLREYIRIAGQRSQMRVLTIASSISGEGSSTIATLLAFLLSGGMEKGLAERVQAEAAGSDFIAGSELALADAPEQDAPAESASTSEDAVQEQRAGEEIFQSRFTDYIQKEAAEALIQAIKKGGVLLVDANLYNPALHRFFGIEQDEGLAEIIEEKRDWRKLTRCLSQGDLHIITAGAAKGKPADIVGSEELRELVKSWREEFRYVIIDAPAVLNYVDALSLSALSDGVILVVRAGQTRWEVAQNAKRKLSVAQANLLGVALNRQKITIPDGFYNRLV
ncbi:MAG TPA: CpsD/CapB family tyrosine-protein kinase [bacterium]|nr:CpsD/CapB family tyrosine-protein kinase [bacterium]HOC23845.1 CpsD/CapB family tyrosine-protein kinase [bacterium]HOH06987.1 CpsD/CapB family tyrosine-protein kinase [bacterium]HOY43239.1 CpsD/CapB family tyrosine-protein kinase [bacterium]HPG82405.1 CpsD/CapB family tyrosine-protein kinase [bacterium]